MNTTPDPTLLPSSWDFYYHLTKCKDWSINGYHEISKGVNSVEVCSYIIQTLSDIAIKGCLIFVMRKDVPPMWECAENINGAYYSFVIENAQSWRESIAYLCEETLFANKEMMNNVCGISISPKKGYCTIKFWLFTDSYKVPVSMKPIYGIIVQKAMFGYHNIQTAITPSADRSKKYIDRDRNHHPNRYTNHNSSQNNYKTNHYSNRNKSSHNNSFNRTSSESQKKY